jgi:uncharacterized protein with PhoU and TrkA domain
MLVNTPWVDRRLSRLISWALERWTDLDVPDYASLLNLAGEYRVVELIVEEGEWLVGRELGELQLNREGVLVLGIYRSDGHYVGTPVGETPVDVGDTLIVYGRLSHIKELSYRRQGPFGDLAHIEAVVEQRELVEEQLREEEPEHTPNTVQ